MRDRDGTKSQSGSSDNWFAGSEIRSCSVAAKPEHHGVGCGAPGQRGCLASPYISTGRVASVATSGWREDFIKQWIVFWFEWIDERDALQRETI